MMTFLTASCSLLHWAAHISARLASSGSQESFLMSSAGGRSDRIVSLLAISLRYLNISVNKQTS